jgi:hypothetical protein
MADDNWHYYMSNEDSGKHRKCDKCEITKIEYHHNKSTGETICGKCADGINPGQESLMIERRKVECQHCKKMTSA